MNFRVGDRVKHPIYGAGQIIDIWPSNKNQNMAVKFDKGGPMGFAKDATNDIGDLTKEEVS